MSQSKPKPTPEPKTPLEAMPDPDPVATLTTTLRTRDNELALAKEELTTLRDRLALAEKNPLMFALIHMDAGSVATEAGAKLSDLSEKVMKQTAAGTLTVKIAVKPLHNALVMTADVTVKAPKADAPASIFYRQPDGLLSREDPRQGRFKFGPGESRADRSAPDDREPYKAGE